MNLKMMAVLGLAWLFTVASSATGGFLYGREQGMSKERQLCQQADINALHGVIDQVAQYAESANNANLVLSNTLAQRKKADQKLTQELEHALSTTSHQRSDCQFDRRVMQLIHQAADRADQAAASGIGDSVRSGTKAQ